MLPNSGGAAGAETRCCVPVLVGSQSSKKRVRYRTILPSRKVGLEECKAGQFAAALPGCRNRNAAQRAAPVGKPHRHAAAETGRPIDGRRGSGRAGRARFVPPARLKFSPDSNWPALFGGDCARRSMRRRLAQVASRSIFSTTECPSIRLIKSNQEMPYLPVIAVLARPRSSASRSRPPSCGSIRRNSCCDRGGLPGRRAPIRVAVFSGARPLR